MKERTVVLGPHEEQIALHLYRNDPLKNGIERQELIQLYLPLRDRAVDYRGVMYQYYCLDLHRILKRLIQKRLIIRIHRGVYRAVPMADIVLIKDNYLYSTYEVRSCV